jgi:hypothetical protein
VRAVIPISSGPGEPPSPQLETATAKYERLATESNARTANLASSLHATVGGNLVIIYYYYYYYYYYIVMVSLNI